MFIGVDYHVSASFGVLADLFGLWSCLAHHSNLPAFDLVIAK